MAKASACTCSGVAGDSCITPRPRYSDSPSMVNHWNWPMSPGELGNVMPTATRPIVANAPSTLRSRPMPRASTHTDRPLQIQ